MSHVISLILFLFILLQKNNLSHAKDNTNTNLIIKTPHAEIQLNQKELQELATSKTFTNIPYGEKTQTLLAIKWETLKKKIFSHPNFSLKKQDIFLDPNSIITFTCLDGFSANLESSNFLQRKDFQPFLVIEDPKHPWPILKNSNMNPGPFALLWEDPKNNIGPEQMPYQLKMLEWKSSLQLTYPKLYPSKKLFNDSEKKGFAVFTKNCFSCHQLNHQGEATIGPDLNLPKNPVEYFNISSFKLLIRDPKSLRSWPESKMPGFNQTLITDIELDHLINYLKLMSKEKYSQNNI